MGISTHMHLPMGISASTFKKGDLLLQHKQTTVPCQVCCLFSFVSVETTATAVDINSIVREFVRL